MNIEMASTSNDTGNEKDWQSGIGTIQERMKYLLESRLDADVEFLVGTGKELEDGIEEKELIRAHKLILKACSSIFVAQFRFDESTASAQDKDAPIEITDISASAFNAMLNFLYTNDISLITKENFFDVYSAAKKYLLNSLVQKCIDMAETMLNEENLFDMLRMAKLHEETDMIKHCLAFIDMNIEFFEAERFFELSQAEMGEILCRDSLQCRESIIFDYLNKWAEKQCEKVGIAKPTGKQKRAAMGALINSIRFPLIDPVIFFNDIVPTAILSGKEITALLLYYGNDLDEEKKKQFPLPFSTHPREYWYLMGRRSGRNSV